MLKINLTFILAFSLVANQALALDVPASLSVLQQANQARNNQHSSSRLDALLQQGAASRLKQSIAEKRKATLARRQALKKQQEELNAELNKLAAEREQAVNEASAAQAIVTEYSGCQEFRSTTHWRRPCEVIHPGFRRIHYADMVKGRAEDDVYLCTRDAAPHQQAKCLLTHILTDRVNEYHGLHPFVVPKRVQAYVMVDDFYSTKKLCFTIKNESTGKIIMSQQCLAKGQELPLPVSTTEDQRFSVVYYKHPKHFVMFDREYGLQLGGIYVYAKQLNYDDTPIKEAQAKLALKLAELDVKEASLRQRQQMVSKILQEEF